MPFSWNHEIIPTSSGFETSTTQAFYQSNFTAISMRRPVLAHQQEKLLYLFVRDRIKFTYACIQITSSNVGAKASVLHRKNAEKMLKMAVTVCLRVQTCNIFYLSIHLISLIHAQIWWGVYCKNYPILTDKRILFFFLFCFFHFCGLKLKVPLIGMFNRNNIAPQIIYALQ